MDIHFGTLVFILMGLISQTSIAAEAVPATSSLDPPCACVAQGRRWSQGDEVCISGLRMVCGMSQNISTWRNLGQSCQISSLKIPKLSFTAL
jgi:hypothetical protein